MALTTPFINTIPSFDATEGTSLALNVLGGDAISGYQFSIIDTNAYDTVIYTSDVIPVSNDIANASIRTFPIIIQPNTMVGFEKIQNNGTYKIRPKTFSETEENGILGNDALFTCYQRGSVKLQHLVDGEYVDFVENTTLSTTDVNMRIVFDKIDLNSIAQPNVSNLTLYGITASGKSLITSIKNIFNFEYDVNTGLYYAEIEVGGFSVNIDSSGLPYEGRQYNGFSIDYDLSTIENMQFSGEIENINCYYEILSNSPIVRINNLCNKGVIEINSELSTLNGTSNIPLDTTLPTHLQFIDNDSVDLRQETYAPDYSEAWVKWSKYFKLGQPYTLRIWGRDFDEGEIIGISNSITSEYIIIKYNKKDFILDGETEAQNYTFISLESGMTNSSGIPCFPYYIESAKILTNTINANTKLFVGIQQQGGLFDIDFEILNN